MHHFTIARRLATGATLFAVAGCGGAVASTTSGAGSTTTQPPASNATLTAATVTGHGSVLVGGSNGMTLYQFDMDTAGSNTSACTGAASAPGHR